jgi:hypothetical protein
MSVFAGPFAIVAIVLAVGGVLKAFEPADTANAMRALRLPGGPLFVRLAGTAEAVVAVAALVTGSTVFVLIVAASYTVFACVVILALRTGRPISSCGCFGKVETPPSAVHVAIDIAAAAAAVGAGIAGAGSVALPDVLADQPLGGVPFILLVGVGVGLTFLALTTLPKTLAAGRAVRG